MAFIGRDPKQPPRTLRHMQKVRRTLNGLLRNDILTQLATGEFTIDHGGLAGLADDDHTQYLLAAGTRALTANWDAGSFQIRAETFQSDVATGTAPLVVASTTVVTNLNADLLDGNDASAFQPIDAQLTSLAALDYTGNAAKVIAVTAGEDGFELVAQSSAVADADYGDVEVSSSGTVWEVQSAAKAFAFAGSLTPAQITANVNDYNPAGLADATVLLLSTDALSVYNITGIDGGYDGRILILHNTSAAGGDLILKNNDANSAADNRFHAGGDFLLGVADSVMIQYEGAAGSGHWHIIWMPIQGDSLTPGSFKVYATGSSGTYTDKGWIALEPDHIPSIAQFLPPGAPVIQDADEFLISDDSDGSANKAVLASQVTDYVFDNAASAQGDIYYRNATEWVRLAAGTSGHFLQTQGAAANPQWASATLDISALTAIGEALADDDLFVVYNTSATANRKLTASELLAYLGAPHLLASATASSSATIDFAMTSWTNSDYFAYLVVLEHVAPATDNVEFWIRTSTDGGSTFDAGASDYRHQRNVLQESGGPGVSGSGADSKMLAISGQGNAANETVSGIVLLFNPSAVQYGKASWDMNYTITTGETRKSLGSGTRVTAADVDAIRFLFSSGNIASGSFKLYGFPVAGVGASSGGGGGDLELLATATASASATVDFAFTSWTNANYIEYILVMTGVAPATDNVTLWLRTSSDGGSTFDATAGDYRWVKLVRGDGGGAAQTQSTSDTEIEMVTDQGNNTNEQLAGEVRIFNPSAAQYCRATWQINYTNPTGNQVEAHGIGTRVSAADVDAIRIMFSSGNIASGEFRLYGKKAA